jgi:hypothetical protein
MLLFTGLVLVEKESGCRAEDDQDVLGGSEEGGPRESAMETCS